MFAHLSDFDTFIICIRKFDVNFPNSYSLLKIILVMSTRRLTVNFNFLPRIEECTFCPLKYYNIVRSLLWCM